MIVILKHLVCNIPDTVDNRRDVLDYTEIDDICEYLNEQNYYHKTYGLLFSE